MYPAQQPAHVAHTLSVPWGATWPGSRSDANTQADIVQAAARVDDRVGVSGRTLVPERVSAVERPDPRSGERSLERGGAGDSAEPVARHRHVDPGLLSVSWSLMSRRFVEAGPRCGRSGCARPVRLVVERLAMTPVVGLSRGTGCDVSTGHRSGAPR